MRIFKRWKINAPSFVFFALFLVFFGVNRFLFLLSGHFIENSGRDRVKRRDLRFSERSSIIFIVFERFKFII